MQVRKFEAKTIKEAIEMVKYHLGPEAIILSAKDNARNFGLMGESSVEVTAAISDAKLNQKKFAEKKLNSRSRQRYVESSAKMQKEYIEKAQTKPMPIPVEAIEEVEPVEKRSWKGITPARYIDIADSGEISKNNTRNDENIIKLQDEIRHLRGLLNKFQSVPQNFVSSHPGADEGLPYELSFAFQKLLDAGVSHKNIVEIMRAANIALPNEHKKKRAFVDGWVIKYMLDRLQVVDKPLKNKFHIFLGPTGQGKTSTIVKIACQLALKEKKRIIILSGDQIKVGATDQLKIYAQILNVPCGVIANSQDWVNANELFTQVDHVLFDTPGMNLKNPQDVDKLRSVLPPRASEMDMHYVQSIMVRDQDAFEVAERFKTVGFKDVIFTRLDEAVQHGIIYNFQKQFNVPLHSFGIGSAIPEDFEFATKERVVDLIFNLSKIKKERGIL
ncbi:MAG: hypothetical protein A2Z20_10330 [Bdellovibrionales bacterium RBG_16_40_8]|nr:MAG: hypothetical protein A2Z20_10330 [Bdellovibrionales bacterium RBG_16_40_8]